MSFLFSQCPRHAAASIYYIDLTLLSRIIAHVLLFFWGIFQKILLNKKYFLCTHGLIKLFIAAMAYYINTLDSQSSGRGRCEPNYFKVGDLFWEIYTSLYANFRKKNLILYVLWKVSNFTLIFYVIRTLHKK